MGVQLPRPVKESRSLGTYHRCLAVCESGKYPIGYYLYLLIHFSLFHKASNLPFRGNLTGVPVGMNIDVPPFIRFPWKGKNFFEPNPQKKRQMQHEPNIACAHIWFIPRHFAHGEMISHGSSLIYKSRRSQWVSIPRSSEFIPASHE